MLRKGHRIKIRKILTTMIVSLTLSFIAYAFRFHNEVIAMKTEIQDNKLLFSTVNSRLDTLDQRLVDIYNLIVETKGIR